MVVACNLKPNSDDLATSKDTIWQRSANGNNFYLPKSLELGNWILSEVYFTCLVANG